MMSTGSHRISGHADGKRIPLHRYGLVTVTDPDQALEYCRRGFPRVEHFGFDGVPRPFLSSADTWLADIRVSSVYSSGHCIEVADDKHVTLIVPLRQDISVSMGRRDLSATPGGMLVIAPGERNTSVGEGYLAGLFKIPAKRIHDRIALLRQSDKPIGLEDIAANHEDPDLSALQSYASFVLGELDRSTGLVSRARAQVIAADLLIELTSLAMSSRSTRTEASSSDASASIAHVRKAEEYIRANAHNAISIGDVANIVGVGARALQLAFRRHRNTTPVRFLNDVRLETAYRRLNSPGHRGNVTQIAFECGITHLGRFASHYSRKYGEPPSATRRRATTAKQIARVSRLTIGSSDQVED